MAYTTVIGGDAAIRESNDLATLYRLKEAESPLTTKEIGSQLRLLVDRVMSDSGFYSPGFAALAIKQAEGDPAEAVFLLSAYRSTISRDDYSTTLPTDNIRVIRRISSSFKDIPGGQILGPTYDFTHRLLDFSLTTESVDDIREFLQRHQLSADDVKEAPTFSKVVDLLRKDGLMTNVQRPRDEERPFDVTRERLRFPLPRSARLQLLSRGECGAMAALAYSSLRGFGVVHPTIAELRVGYLSVTISDPYGDDDDCLYIGEVMVTEVETINSFEKDEESGSVFFTLGYGLVFGQNEVKAISMAILERSLDVPGPAPAQDEEFVLMHINSLESNGFISHLKLPHYTTFQASLDRIRSVKQAEDGRARSGDSI